MQTLVRGALALILAAAAVTRLARPAATQPALAVFGVPSGPIRWVAWGSAAAVELVLAAGVARGSAPAAGAAAALMLGYAGALLAAIGRGRAGAPCGCFGARSRVSRAAVARNVALAAGFAAVGFLPESSGLSADAWLAAGLAVALLAIVLLTVAVLALAREVGTLRMRLAPEQALEIAGEGPELGSRSMLGARLPAKDGALLGLSVFTSDGCPLCQALAPAVRAFERDPVVALATFDEVRDADVWHALAVPGSPYAVATDRDGVVRAKGAFNSFGQLESILASAERRLAEPAGA